MAITAACTRSNTQQETGGSSTTTSGQSASSGDVQQAIADGNFGTLKKVCGPAPASGPGTSDSQGVTADSVTIGTISDPGSTLRAGLNQELFDASEVFTQWCNDLGGINGHKIDLDEHDAALFNYKQVMIQACQKDFALVGGGGVFDDQGQETRVKCLLPDFPAYVVTPTARASDLIVQSTPTPNDKLNVGTFRYLAATFPDAKEKLGVMWGDLPSLTTNKDQYVEAAETLGYKVVDQEKYPAAGTSNWVPYAQSVANKGVKGLFYVGEPENLALLVNAFAQINYKLDYIVAAANQYDVKLVNGAKSSLDAVPVFVNAGFVPFEMTDQNPALQTYEALFEKYKPSGKSHAALGLNSFSAWLMFAESAKSCTSGLTRKCVYDAMKKVAKWDAGGMAGTADPSTSSPSDCTITMKATSHGFTPVKWEANQGVFNCDPANVVALKGKYGSGVTLQSLGLSMNDLH
jgi:ABC-type branched-subunit amino acid transport system substrate-binding protein